MLYAKVNFEVFGTIMAWIDPNTPGQVLITGPGILYVGSWEGARDTVEPGLVTILGGYLCEARRAYDAGQAAATVALS